MIEFHQEEHRYIDKVTRREYTPVSNLLKMYGFSDTKGFEIAQRKTGVDYAQRGTDIHRTLRLLAAGVVTAEYYSQDPNYGYIQAGSSFLQSWGASIIATESIVYDDTVIRLAGTIDIIAKTLRGDVVIADWKTGGQTPSQPLQMAAYMHLLSQGCKTWGLPEPVRAITVHVKKDGTFKTQDSYRGVGYASPEARVALFSILRVEEMRQRLGAKGEVQT